jgi:hypothetical protein
MYFQVKNYSKKYITQQSQTLNKSQLIHCKLLSVKK